MALTFGAESFTAAEPEIAGLVEEHWREVSDIGEVPLDIDWQHYRNLEAGGQLFTLAVRDEGRLVGYVIHLVVYLPHYRTTLVARDDAHYLHPDYRRGSAGARMIRAAERALKVIGVKRILYHTKTRAGLDRTRLFERLGYQPVETIVSKVLED